MDIKQLSNTVQLNCHISDARHAGNYTLCIYLLKMREFYRWEENHNYSDKLATDDIGSWLTSREALWSEIEDHDYQTLDINELAVVINSQALNHPVALGFALTFIVVGLCFKLGAVPFHMWLPDIYQGSPTSVTLFIATAPKIAGFAMAIRLLVDGLGGLQVEWSQMLMVR